jgi:hypothetical protein
VVLVESKAEIIVFGRVGLRRQKIPDFRFALLEFFQERSEPTWELAPFGGEGGEPHLPIQTRLEGGDLGREPICRTSFVGKLDRLPLDSIGTAFEGEFGASSGHNGEESVAGVKMPWSEGFFPLSEKG